VRCLRLLVWFTVFGTLLLVGIAYGTRTFNYDGRLLTRVSEYFFWAFLQQIGLQTFLTYRVKKALGGPYLTSVVSAAIFALIHIPNLALVGFAGLGGF